MGCQSLDLERLKAMRSCHFSTAQKEKARCAGGPIQNQRKRKMSKPILPQNKKTVTLLRRFLNVIGLAASKATLRQDALRAKAHGLVASDRAARREGGAA